MSAVNDPLERIYNPDLSLRDDGVDQTDLNRARMALEQTPASREAIVAWIGEGGARAVEAAFKDPSFEPHPKALEGFDDAA